jgi:hypothetical protein
MRTGVFLSLLTAMMVGCGVDAALPEPPVDEAQAELRLLRPYLALGDSIAFGYNPVDAQEPSGPVDRFTGYPELIGRALIAASNASCPGETSSSLIDATEPDNGCRAWRQAGGAMHVQYAGVEQSQLDYALEYLKWHPDTATVSLGIGANDLLLLQSTCAADHYDDPDATQRCIGEGIPSTIETAARNVARILTKLRRAGYVGEIVVVTYYSLQYTDREALDLQAIAGLDQALVSVAQKAGDNVTVATGFSAFASVAATADGDACQAGLLYALPDGTCDKHPSAFGQAVLALAIATAETSGDAS